MKLLEYVSKPYICKFEKPKISKLLFYCLAYFGVAFISILIIYPITKLVGIEHISQKDYSISVIFFSVFFAPIFEEIICRLSLVANKKNYFIVIVSLILLTLNSLYKEKYLITIILSGAILLLIGLNFLDKTCLKTFYIKYFKYIFWYSAILFGLLHMFNYQGNYLIILSLSPILCFPQIVMGFILGYIRMNYGFVYGVIVHMIINSAILLFLF